MENFEIKLAGSDISSWQAKLPDLRLTLKQLLSRPLPYGLFRNIHCTDEEISSDLENPDTTQIGLQKLAVREVDGQKKSLTELCDKFKAALYLILPEHLITLDEIKQVITRVASRVCYGVYDKNVVINEDTNPLGMYIWEAQDNPQSNEIKQKRKMTKKMICSLYKLINAIDRAVPNEINIQNLYDAYSKAFKSYDGFEKEQNEKKRKREQAEQEKAEKRAKVEEDKRAKAQRLEEEKRLAREKKEEEKRAKEAQRMEEKQKREAERAAQQPRLKMPQPVAEPVKPSGPRISTFFAPKTGPIVTESQIARANEKFMRTPDIGAGLSGWIEVFRAHQRPLRDSRNLQYILIEESDKKPYYCGMHQPQYSVGRLCTAPFAALQEVDYEKDSEEEMLEMDAESLSASSSGDTDEEDSLSEGEKQWIVADGYFSDGEVSDTEL